jgi:hypothetical protein
MPYDALIPDEARIYSWIEQVYAQGVRRPGYPADRWAEQFCLDRFRDFGLEKLRLEPVELPYWEPRQWTLTVEDDSPSGGQTLDIPSFPLPHSATTTGLEGQLVAFEEQSPEEAKGCIALHDLPLTRPRHAALAERATWCYDPGETFAHSRQILPFSRLGQPVMEPAIKAGALAFVGSLTDYPSDSHDYYVPYDAVPRPIPGVWISGSDGARLHEMLAAGPVRAHLAVESVRESVTTHNVTGELPGADDEVVIIGSHHDGPWSSAVEDGSGIALVLAQAQYWSQVAREERPHRLVFLLNSGHMAGGAGARAFVEAHKAMLARTVLEVHLEHAANECTEEGGQTRPTGHPEARWWFTSRIPDLEAAVRVAIEAEDLRRSLIMPPTAFGPAPTTDGAAFHLAGVPLVNFLTAPFYLFDSQDTLDKIHRPSLVPVTRAAIRIIESTTGKTANAMRAAMSKEAQAISQP